MYSRRAGSLISCSCASTSTATPCAHALRSYANAAAPPPTKERTPSKALDFTAPLFEHKRGTAPWFNPSTTSGWERWMRKSRAVLFNTQPNLVAPSVPSTSTPTRIEDSRDRNKLALVKSYLALRSSTHSLLRMLPQPTIKRLLDDTERYNLPLVNQILSEDLRNLKITATKWQEAKDRDVAGNLAGYSEREIVNQLDRANEMDAARKLEVEVKQEKEEKLLSWMGEDYGNDTWSEVVNSLDQQQARRHLLSIVDSPSIDTLPPIVLDSFPEISDLERLDRIWSQFSYSPLSPESTPPSLSGEDYRLSLSLLLKIVTPSYTNSQSALPLALKIFRRLISSRSIPQEAIADTPDEMGVDGEALSSEIIFRLVILRTIVGAATEQKEYATAMDALRVLASIRSNQLEIGELTTDVDFKLLQDQFEDTMYYAQELFRNHYRLRAPLSASDPLLVAFSFLYEILPSFSHPPLTRPSSSLIVQLLQEFTIEAAKRERYDLIGPLWEKMGEFDGHSWIAFPIRIKLLRWFGGAAPFSTYVEGFDVGGTKDRPMRATNSNAFYDFAVGTFVVLSQRRFVNPIAMSDRYVFLRTLCEGRITSGRTLDLAIRFYQLFKSTSTIDNPFILAPATLLSLVRSCTVKGSGIDSTNFANKLISDHVSLLTSPTSPYSSPSRRILPQDISTLAQCYSIVGDHESTGQVYRKLLDQKMIPDRKDLLIIFGTTARWNPKLARSNLRLAWETGIVITVEMVRVVLLNTIAYLRTEGIGSTNDVQHILQLGRKLGLTAEEIHHLDGIASSLRIGGKKGKEFAEWNLDDEKLWEMTQRTSLEETRPSVLCSLIRKAGKDDAWRSIITLFRRGIDARIIDERIINVALSGLLSTYRTDRPSVSKRQILHHSMREIIDYALSTTPTSLSNLTSNRSTIPIMRQETFETILSCCLKLADLGAVEVVRERMREGGFEGREETWRAVRSLEVQLMKAKEGVVE